MAQTIGFIGTGTMGGAVVKAAAKCAPDTLFLLANRTAAKAEATLTRTESQTQKSCAFASPS